MNLFREIHSLLARGESFVLVTILTRSGSAPRAVGTRMVVRSDGTIIGTIGGGILEAQTQNLAEELFLCRKTLIKKFVLSTDDAARMGMICGGELQVLIHFVDAAEPARLHFYEGLLTALEKRKHAWLITKIPEGDESGESPAQWLVDHKGRVSGAPTQEKVGDFVKEASRSRPEVIQRGEQRYLLEPLANEGTVYIFGAGHVSRKLAPLTVLVGFRTVVLDDREEFANRERFGSAEEVIVLDSFDEALEGLQIDEDSCVVIVTRGHAHDKKLLGQALKTGAGYIGMIGSRRKRDTIYEGLAREGFTVQDFKRVHSPIGLDIGAETPEEIAVSIVAELIQKRTERKQ